jgi:hypothetical protein
MNRRLALDPEETKKRAHYTVLSVVFQIVDFFNEE